MSDLVPTSCDTGDVRAVCEGLVALGPVTECFTVETNATPDATVTVDWSTYPVVELEAEADTEVAFTWAASGATPRWQTGVLYVETNGATRTITWPASVLWPGGSAPSMPLAASSLALFVFSTPDDGTTVLGNVVGLEYA